PVGGAPGTRITVTGRCVAPEGNAQLQTSGGDAIGVYDRKEFRTDAQGQFQVELTNTLGSGEGFPSEAIVQVFCFDRQSNSPSLLANKPFHATDLGSTSVPTVYTAPGPGICGYSNVAPPSPPSPCGARVKAFDSDGAIGPTNFFVDGWAHG